MRGRRLVNRRLRFHAALLFLLWSLLPHYSLFLHTHADDAHGHSHARAGQAFLGQILAALNGPSITAEAATFSADSNPDRSARATPAPWGAPVLEHNPAAYHGHYETHANVQAAATETLIALPAPAVRSASAPAYREPDLRPLFSRPARGPPTSFIA